MRLKAGRPSLWSCLVVLFLVAPALAQSTATLRGRIADAEGGALPGAAITLRNQATGEERSAVSDRQGEYQIAALPRRRLPARVRADGFQAAA